MIAQGFKKIFQSFALVFYTRGDYIVPGTVVIHKSPKPQSIELGTYIIALGIEKNRGPLPFGPCFLHKGGP